MKKSDNHNLPVISIEDGLLVVTHGPRKKAFQVSDIIPGLHAPDETPLRKYFRQHGIAEAFADNSLYFQKFPVKEPSRYVVVALCWKVKDQSTLANPVFNPLKRKDPNEREATFGRPGRPGRRCSTEAPARSRSTLPKG